MSPITPDVNNLLVLTYASIEHGRAGIDTPNLFRLIIACLPSFLRYLPHQVALTHVNNCQKSNDLFLLLDELF